MVADGFSMRLTLFLAVLVLIPVAAGAQELSVAYQDGRLTVHCTNAPLSDLLDLVEQRTGIDVAVKVTVSEMCRPTVIEDQPVAHALERLMADHGLSYVMVLDRGDEIGVVSVFRSGKPDPVRPPVRPVPARFRRR